MGLPSMNTVQTIYTHLYRKYERKFNTILKNAALNFKIEAISYQRCYANKKVLSLPLLVDDRLGEYYNSPNADKAIFLDFRNLLLSPTINSTCYKNAVYQLYNQSFCFDHIISNESRSALPWHLHYHNDHSISFLCVFVNKTDAILANKVFYSGYFNRLHQAIEQSVLANTRELDLNDFIFNNSSPTVPLLLESVPKAQFAELSYAENLCFLAIYQGHYEVKEIAEYINRSPRTIEGHIASMIQKLKVNNRYELFIKLAQAHEHMRYLAHWFWIKHSSK
jgi:DNA-binding CsgD family transcriptional regulator